MFDDLRPLFSSYNEKHMITPNIDKLAYKSIIFQNTNCQVAVCNPSRNSLMTGLRPDTIKSYAFSNSWLPHLSFPQHLSSIGYNIGNYGKIYHWDDFDDKLNISYGIRKSNWYEYQGSEYDNLNSTVNPDRNTPEENFRDYIYTTKLIEGLNKVVSLPNYFFLGIGYKLPHIHLHYPWKYYDMYRSRSKVWNQVTTKHLRYPPSSPPVSYRCCAYGEYKYMKDEGNAKFDETLETNSNLTRTFPTRMYRELIWSYSASITYLDTQIGRILDTIEEMGLWNNITIILTSDHGMHNGEKGIWEKWTLFEEATRVPLLIYHPKSPFPGQKYDPPVELLDIYPTILDIVGSPQLLGKDCPPNSKCRPLDGQSLAPVIFGANFKKEQNQTLESKSLFQFPKIFQQQKMSIYSKNSEVEEKMPQLSRQYAVTQAIRCVSIKNYNLSKTSKLSFYDKQHLLSTMWFTCGDTHNPHELSFMGYSMRTLPFRYTTYFHFDRRINQIYNLSQPKYLHYLFEELYDHRQDHTMSLINRELVNVARSPKYSDKLKEMREKMITFLKRTPIRYLSHQYRK